MLLRKERNLPTLQKLDQIVDDGQGARASWWNLSEKNHGQEHTSHDADQGEAAGRCVPRECHAKWLLPCIVFVSVLAHMCFFFTTKTHVIRHAPHDIPK